MAVLRTQVAVLEKFGELSLDPDTRQKLTRISAATIDRLLRTEKRALRVRGRCHTKPTTRLINEIPIRTFTEWQDARPGEVGADLVGHDGGITGGEHAFTLVVTDRLTQWTEVRAVLNKAQKWVFQALLLIGCWLPFALCSLHTDNGSEFINHHLTATASRSASSSPVRGPTARTTATSPRRKTTTWCAATAALPTPSDWLAAASWRRGVRAYLHFSPDFWRVGHVQEQAHGAYQAPRSGRVVDDVGGQRRLAGSRTWRMPRQYWYCRIAVSSLANSRSSIEGANTRRGGPMSGCSTELGDQLALARAVWDCCGHLHVDRVGDAPCPVPPHVGVGVWGACGRVSSTKGADEVHALLPLPVEAEVVEHRQLLVS